MTDVVAIVSIASSATVGICGAIVPARSAAQQRRWESTEERTTELRDVLDGAAVAMANSMQVCSRCQSLAHVVAANGYPPDHPLVLKADGEYGEVLEHQHELWRAWNRLRVRLGPKDPVAAAVLEAQQEIGRLGALVVQHLHEHTDAGFDVAWAKASSAERAFYAAAATELAGEVPRSRAVGLRLARGRAEERRG